MCVCVFIINIVKHFDNFFKNYLCINQRPLNNLMQAFYSKSFYMHKKRKKRGKKKKQNILNLPFSINHWQIN